MAPAVRIALLCIVLGVFGMDALWQAFAHFDIDWHSYLGLAAFLPAPLFGGLFYTYVRRDDRLAAMLLGLSFLLAFSPACSITTYFALSVAGHRIDGLLAAADRMMGVDWPALLRFVARHDWLNATLFYAYRLSIWQVVAVVFILGWRGRPGAVGRLCFSIAICGLCTAAIWAAFPSFGAITIYWMPDAVAAKLHAPVDNAYGRELLRLLAQGPGRITSDAVRGVIGFPSFHTEEAIVATWYLRHQRALFWPFLVFNVFAVGATPIQGGHHVADVIGGLALAAAAIAASDRLAGALERIDARLGWTDQLARARIAVNQ